MAPAVPHIALVAEGSLGNAESWSCTLNIAAENNLQGDAVGDLKTLVNDCYGAMVTLCVGGSSYASSVANMRGLTGRRYDAQGKLVDQFITVPEAPDLGTGVPRNPWTTCMTLTLRSNLPTRRGRGRMFIPAIAREVGPEGTFNPTQVQEYLGVASGSLRAINAAAGRYASGWYASVISGANASQGIWGARRILTIDADTRPDVQRSRSRDLVTRRLTAAL